MSEFKFCDLFIESPYAAALSTKYLQSYCSNCFFPAKKSCGKCSSVVYCGRQCQMEDWPWHKAECNAFVERRKEPANKEEADTAKTQQEDADEEFIRLIGRVLSRKRKDGGVASLSEGFPSFAKERCFGDLMSHVGDFDKTTMDSFTSQFRRFYRGHNLNNVNDNELLQTIGRVLINDFSVNSTPDARGTSVALGVALYLNASRFDHTCERNAKLEGDFDGARLRLRFVINDKIEGDQLPKTEKAFNRLTLCYGFGGFFWTAVPWIQQRRDALRMGYFFECRCRRCEDHLDGILAWDAAARECTSCRCPYVLDGDRHGRLFKFCGCVKREINLPLACKDVPHAEDNDAAADNNTTCPTFAHKRATNSACCAVNKQSSTNPDTLFVVEEKANVENHWCDDPTTRMECERIQEEWSDVLTVCIGAQSALDAISFGEPFRQIAAKYWHPVYNLRLTQLNETLFAAYRALALAQYADSWLFDDDLTPMTTFRFDIPNPPPVKASSDCDDSSKRTLRLALQIGEMVFRAFEHHLPPYDQRAAGHCLRLGELFELASILCPSCLVYQEMAVYYYTAALYKWAIRDYKGTEKNVQELQFRIERARGAHTIDNEADPATADCRKDASVECDCKPIDIGRDAIDSVPMVDKNGKQAIAPIRPKEKQE